MILVKVVMITLNIIFIKSLKIFEFHSWVFVQWFQRTCSKEIQPVKIPAESEFLCKRTNDDHNHTLKYLVIFDSAYLKRRFRKKYLKRIQDFSKDFGLRKQLLYFQQTMCHKGLVTYSAISNHTFQEFLSPGINQLELNRGHH